MEKVARAIESLALVLRIELDKLAAQISDAGKLSKEGQERSEQALNDFQRAVFDLPEKLEQKAKELRKEN